MLVRVGDAVASGVINNETLAYYMARTHLFLLQLGIDRSRLRFRQHLSTEMAHYAADCWDAEIFGSYGWIECVGHADRSAFDLKVHTAASGKDLSAQETFDKPKIVPSFKLVINRGALAKKYNKSTQMIIEKLNAMDSMDEARRFDAELANGPVNVTLSDGSQVAVDSAAVSVRFEDKKVNTDKFTPSVIEPSFGIGRILYHVLEHAFYQRNTDSAAPAQNSAEVSRTVFRLPPFLAPVKVVILPISAQSDLMPILEHINRTFTAQLISCRVDSSSGSIGKRYSRADEIGTPFAITLDFETLEQAKGGDYGVATVTLRERDSTEQVRLSIDNAISTVKRLIESSLSYSQDNFSWANVTAQYSRVTRPSSDD